MFVSRCCHAGIYLYCVESLIFYICKKCHFDCDILKHDDVKEECYAEV